MKKTVVRYILNWIEKNIHSDTGVGELVGEVGFSRSTVEIWFRRTCGISLGEYLMRRRMSRAAVLLRMTVLSITEIATLFHFHSSQNFARAFRKITGLTPTQYRTQPEWQFSVLQQPLLMEGAMFERLSECELPELTLYGSVTYFQDSILSSDLRGSEYLKSMFVSGGEHHGRNMCIASRAIPGESPEAGRNALLNVEMIVETNEPAIACERFIIPAGRYGQFSFSGTWAQYYEFSRMVYFCLAKEGRGRRDSYDLLYFSPSEEGPERINCQYFLPIF